MAELTSTRIVGSMFDGEVKGLMKFGTDFHGKVESFDGRIECLMGKLLDSPCRGGFDEVDPTLVDDGNCMHAN
jgi:hypothetical protein